MGKNRKKGWEKIRNRGGKNWNKRIPGWGQFKTKKTGVGSNQNKKIRGGVKSETKIRGGVKSRKNTGWGQIKKSVIQCGVGKFENKMENRIGKLLIDLLHLCH